MNLCARLLPTCSNGEKNKMKPSSKKFTASTAALFTFGFSVITAGFLVMTAPTAHAEGYCITNGAQVAHGCGFPTMEACRATSSGIGGTCAPAPGGGSGDSGNFAANSFNNPRNALGYVPPQPRSRGALHLGRHPTRHRVD